MNRDQITTGLVLALLLAIFYLFGRIILPFAAPIIWAGVLALLFRPLYIRLLARTKGRPTLAALLITLVILVVLIGPIAFLTVALVNEAADAVARVNALYQSGELQKYLDLKLPLVDGLKEKLSQYYDFSQLDLNEVVRNSIDKIGKFVIDQAGSIISNGTRAVFYFILMLVTIYYFLKDGDKLVGWLRKAVPLPREQVDAIFAQLGEVIISTISSGLFVAFLQGLIGGILFAAVGLPSPIFWGAVMAFLSLLPVIGAFIVYIPAGVVLIVSGSTVKGIIVFAVGLGLISQLDNFLRPQLMAGRTALHPLLLFLSMMGGIAAFGFTGMILGPVVVAAFVAMAGVRGEA
jgi:predicted PurR-regulated permease PerM